MSKVLTMTTELPPVDFPIPSSFKDALAKSSGSAAGYSAVSEWLGCPEKSRLKKLGIRRRGGEYTKPDELSDLDFGQLCHLLRAIRIVHGHAAVEACLDYWRHEIPNVSWLKARMMFRVYESLYPEAQDGFDYLGVEAEVVTNVADEGAAPILRTVRYDTVIRVPGVGGASPELFTFECKTMSRGGLSSIQPYTGQVMCQVMLWNQNPYLVEKYGRMAGVIFDGLVKTATPNVERYGPIYFGRVHHKLARQYLASADNGNVIFGKLPDGSYPKMLHACWGRWRACEYIAGCHEEAWGEYENADGSEVIL